MEMVKQEPEEDEEVVVIQDALLPPLPAIRTTPVRRNPSIQYKLNIVQRVKNGESIRSVSRDIGFDRASVRAWVRNESKMLQCRSVDMKRVIRTRFSQQPELEDAAAKYIRERQAAGDVLSYDDVRHYVMHECPTVVPESFKCSAKWLMNVCERNGLSIGTNNATGGAKRGPKPRPRYQSLPWDSWVGILPIGGGTRPPTDVEQQDEEEEEQQEEEEWVLDDDESVVLRVPPINDDNDLCSPSPLKRTRNRARFSQLPELEQAAALYIRTRQSEGTALTYDKIRKYIMNDCGLELPETFKCSTKWLGNVCARNGLSIGTNNIGGSKRGPKPKEYRQNASVPFTISSSPSPSDDNQLLTAAGESLPAIEVVSDDTNKQHAIASASSPTNVSRTPPPQSSRTSPVSPEQLDLDIQWPNWLMDSIRKHYGKNIPPFPVRKKS